MEKTKPTYEELEKKIIELDEKIEKLKRIDEKISLYNILGLNKPEEEIAYCDLGKCYHDESPNKPCEKIERYEIRKDKKVKVK